MNEKTVARVTNRLPQRVRKEQIVQIATKLFAQKGYDGTSLRDVADVSGLTKAALYYHFPDKEYLYEAVVSAKMNELLSAVKTAVAREGDPVLRIRAFLLACGECIDVDSSGWQASSRTFWSMEDRHARERVVALRDEFEGILRGLIREAVEQGLLRDVDTALLTRLFLGGLNMIPRWHKPDKGLKAVQIVEQYVTFVLEGVRAPRHS